MIPYLLPTPWTDFLSSIDLRALPQVKILRPPSDCRRTDIDAAGSLLSRFDIREGMASDLSSKSKEDGFDEAKAAVIARSCCYCRHSQYVRARARDRAKNAESKSCSVSKRHETSAEFSSFLSCSVGRSDVGPLVPPCPD